MNYNSVQEIINAGTTNMTALVSGSSYDDNNYAIGSIPEWLIYNGIHPTTIYASGNSWLGMGSTTEHIKFNRRDAKMNYLYKEEGTLKNSTRFFKIRWRGYPYYSSTSYSITWEVVFFDSGDFMLHLVTKPSSYYTGTFNVVASTTYTYTAPSSSTSYVTFYSLDGNNSTFRIAYEICDPRPKYNNKWLVEDGGVFYHQESGALVPVNINAVTAENMMLYGDDDPPDGELLEALTQPTIYHWNDSDETDYPTQPVIQVSATVQPFTQEIGLIVDMSDETILGIGELTAQYSGTVKIKYSLDDGSTYTNEMALSDFLNVALNNLFNSLPNDKKLYLKIYIYEGATLSNIKFTYINTV